MTRFELLIVKSEIYKTLSEIISDNYLKKFYKNVASGYRERAVSLSIEEGGQII